MHDPQAFFISADNCDNHNLLFIFNNNNCDNSNWNDGDTFKVVRDLISYIFDVAAAAADDDDDDDEEQDASAAASAAAELYSLVYIFDAVADDEDEEEEEEDPISSLVSIADSFLASSFGKEREADAILNTRPPSSISSSQTVFKTVASSSPPSIIYCRDLTISSIEK